MAEQVKCSGFDTHKSGFLRILNNTQKPNYQDLKKMENRGREENPDEVLHVAMFPWFAFGHINPFIHLSNKLASNGVKISFLSAPANIPKTKHALIESTNTQIIPLNFPAIEGLPPGVENTSEITDPFMAELLKQALDQMEPHIRTLLAQLKPHIVLYDFAQHWIPNIASELCIKSVFFSVFSAISVAYPIVPERIEPLLKGTAEMKEPSIEELKSPPKGYPKTSHSLKTFEAKVLLHIFKSFCGPPAIMRGYVGIQGSDAIAVESCTEFEGPYIEYLKTQYGKPVLMAGLALPDQNPSSADLEPRLATWLDQFPSKSVVFCSFESEGYLDDEKVKELAIGLEQTGLPFFLVLNFRDGSDQTRLDQALPSGFRERVKDRGMVQTGWAQQQQILAHESVGCYVCHSGFGSMIEGLVGDCQLVMMPLKRDQFMNTKLFSLDLEVGVEVNRRDNDGYFGKSDILEAVKVVMVDVDKEPGKSIRVNHSMLRKFLMNKEAQQRYISDLITDLKALAWNDDGFVV